MTNIKLNDTFTHVERMIGVVLMNAFHTSPTRFIVHCHIDSDIGWLIFTDSGYSADASIIH